MFSDVRMLVNLEDADHDGRGCSFIAKGVSNRPDGFGKKNRQLYTYAVCPIDIWVSCDFNEYPKLMDDGSQVCGNIANHVDQTIVNG